MRHSCWFLLLAVCLTGCEWLKNLGPTPDANPVMGDPPPRMRFSDQTHRPNSPGRTHLGNDPTIVRVSTGGGGNPADQLSGAQRVAMVDGSPILASEVLDRYQVKFDQIRSEASPTELREIREKLIKRDLHHHVERRLLVNALKASLPKNVVGKLDEIIDKAFDSEIKTMKEELKVDTKAQLEEKLIEQGTSLANLRDSFANQQMAAQFFQSKLKKKTLIGRPEMLKYYNEHLAKYKIPAKVRWQEIQINFDGNGGRDGAFQVLRDKVVADLKAGQSFDEVARKYSNGITAKDGGTWDWTIAGSLTDKQVDNALFQLPVGEISQALEGKRSFRLVKVIDRTQAGWKPFSEVHNEIQAALEKEDRERHAKQVVDQLMANAVITTIFDDDPTYQPEWRTRQKQIADRR